MFKGVAMTMGAIVLAGAALAEPLASSPWPKPKPGRVTMLTGMAPEGMVPVARPRPRPATAQLTPVFPDVPLSSSSAPAASVAPPPRPADLKHRMTLAAVTVPSRPAPEPKPSRKGSVCDDPAIRGATISPVVGKLKGCGLRDGVSVTAVSGVRLSEAAIMDCPTARALKDWIGTGVVPSVGNLGGGVAGLEVAASYSCRGRNNQKVARISEHGRGRAIDIAAIVLQNGTLVSVLKGWGTAGQGKVLKKIRKAACGPFNTVLGPGSDRFHRNHFHLDTAQGRGPYCH